MYTVIALGAVNSIRTSWIWGVLTSLRPADLVFKDDFFMGFVEGGHASNFV
jgi:hypothetical protein